MAGATTRREILRRGGVAALGLGVAPGTLAACGGGGARDTRSAGAGPPRKGGRLRIAAPGNGSAETLDPNRWTTAAELQRAKAMHETLWNRKADGRVTAGLAEAWEPNADASVWKVKLRHGVAFHDGRALTADDVLYTLRLVGDPKGPYGNARAAAVDTRRTRRLDRLTLSIVLDSPNADFPNTLTQDPMIVPDGMKTFSRPNGTGPFRFVEWRVGERSLLRRNERYWGREPHLDEVEILSVGEEQARVNALLSRKIDYARLLGFAAVKRLRTNDRTQILEVPGSVSPPIYMRLDARPFNDVRVRQAMRLAIDREKCVNVGQFGFGGIGNDLFGPAAPSYNADLPQREYDPEKARSLLAAAGHRDGLRVQLVTSTTFAGMLEGAQLFKQSAKAARIAIDIRQVPPNELFNPNATYLQVACGMTWWAGISFEDHVGDTMLPGAENNETAWRDKAWIDAFLKARTILDERERRSRYKELQAKLWEDGGYIVWGVQPRTEAMGADVRGLAPWPGTTVGPADLIPVWLDR